MKQLALMLALVLGLALATQSVSFAQEDGGEESAPEQPTEGSSEDGGE